MKNQQKRLANLLLHLACWALLFIIPVIFRPHPYTLFLDQQTEHLFFVIPLSGILFLSAIYYFNYYILLQKVLKGYGRRWYFFVAISCFGIFIFLQWSLRTTYFNNFRLSFDNELSTENIRRISFRIIILLNLLIWVISSSTWLLRQWNISEKRLKETAYQKSQIELNLLKKQIHPHFLFNTLNSIYALTIVDHDLAGKAILKLSKLMNYFMDEANHDFVELTHEINYLEAYVDLNRLRLSEKSPLYFQSIMLQPSKYFIAPLLMIAFVENAFKYGISNVVESPIHIELFLKESRLVFFCQNRILPQQNIHNHQFGMGIANAKRRLELIYPNAHNLSITNDGECFSVHLEIDLNQAKINKINEKDTIKLPSFRR